MSPVPSLNLVNVYDGLFYNAWNLDQSTVALGLSGVPAHSPPTFIATAQVTSQTLRGTPSLTVDYTGSNVVFFDLFSFWFGCTRPAAQNNVNLATQCTVLVAGFDAQNKEKAVAMFTFTPTATQLTNTPMIQAVLPTGFTGLHNVTVVQSSPTTQVLQLDNVKYKTYSL